MAGGIFFVQHCKSFEVIEIMFWSIPDSCVANDNANLIKLTAIIQQGYLTNKSKMTIITS